MGKLESENKRKIRSSKINKAIVASLAIAGVLTVAALAPNALAALGKSPFVTRRKYQIKKAFSRMLLSGYIVLEKRNGTSYARLTEKGRAFAALQIAKRSERKPPRWDGKWRILIFDIPEQRRRVRNQIRITLSQIGFTRLQNSVWVYPYDCEDLVILLKADFKIGKEMLYIIADQVENDPVLRKKFHIT